MNLKERGMLAQVRCPVQLAPHELDAYLERGWFRMRQNIFTTNFVHFRNEYYSAIWLRVKLHEFSQDKTREKIFKRNAGFKTEIRPAIITPEKEELYSQYKKHLPFEPMSTLGQLLLADFSPVNIYNTYEAAVYDGNKLIAIGFFDVGADSAAGIAAVYDHDYGKYSLGKFLIYLKMEYCKGLSMQYFYPGYFVPGYAAFDYKLSIGKSAIEFLQLKSQQWMPLEKFSPDNIPYEVMLLRLKEVQKLLAQSKFESKILKYEFFDANLFPELMNARLFDFPVMLFCSDHVDDDLNHVIVFDVRDDQYHLLQCVPVYAPNAPNADPDFYSEYIIKEEQAVLSTTASAEMVDWIITFLNAKKNLGIIT
jgi:arginine-tRNA-protein transferase